VLRTPMLQIRIKLIGQSRGDGTVAQLRIFGAKF